MTPELRVPAGPPWTAPADVPSDGLGLLVLKGVLVRRTSVNGRFGAELLGENSVLQAPTG